MVSFTSRARLIKPASSGEVVDVAQVNANMDKIDQNLGVYLCTSTTRPTDPFPGQVIRETDTGRTLSRNPGNTGWDPAISMGYSENYSPGYTSALGTNATAYSTVHRFYMGPAGGANDPDLLIQGVFFLQFTTLGAAAATSIQAAVGTGETNGNLDTAIATDTLVNYKEVPAITAADWRDALPFSLLLSSTNPKRYLKLGAKRSTGSSSATWQNGAGLSYSLMVTPVSKKNDMASVVPGFNVDV